MAVGGTIDRKYLCRVCQESKPEMFMRKSTQRVKLASGIVKKYISYSICIKCDNIRRREYDKNNKDTVKKKRHDYYLRNQDYVKQKTSSYSKANRLAIYDARRVTRSRYNMNLRLSLADAYVKQVLWLQYGYKIDFPENIIKAKRQQLTLHRLMRASKNKIETERSSQ